MASTEASATTVVAAALLVLVVSLLIPFPFCFPQASCPRIVERELYETEKAST
jgi:hypothetical protein